MSFKRSFRRRKMLEQITGGWGSGWTSSYMIYRCKKCGKEWRMYLESGLEEKGTFHRPHKPVPFIVKCSCGGMANDVSGLMKLPNPIPIEDHMSHFANRHDKDCGMPVLRGEIHGE